MTRRSLAAATSWGRDPAGTSKLSTVSWVAPTGAVWYTAQGSGQLGRLDPVTGDVEETPLGAGSRPHGVIIGPDDAPWVTDGGRNSIIRVDPASRQVTEYPLPRDRPDANLNTAVFDRAGVLWFTGQSGVYGLSLIHI